MAGNGSNDYNQIVQEIEHSYMTDSSSKEFTEVAEGLRKLNALMQLPVSPNTAPRFFKARQELMAACENYQNTHKSAWTHKGKERIGLVGELLTFTKSEDYEAYRDPDFLKAKIAQAGGRNQLRWKDAATDARMKQITATAANMTTVGAGASTRISTQDQFFTQSAPLVSKSEDEIINEKYNSLDPSLKAKISLQIFKEVATTIEGATSGDDAYNRLYQNDKRIAEFLIKPENREIYEAAKAAGKELTSQDNSFHIAHMQSGADSTKNNVATSRLASMLGQGNVVAKSETAVLHTPNGDVVGVSMAKAVGCDPGSENEADLAAFEAVNSTNFDNPQFKKQLMALQIMDRLAGQTDRHGKNMFYQIDPNPTGNPPKKQIIGIQGIDNDIAFGLHTKINDAVSQKSGRLEDIEAIDAELYSQIMSMNKDVVDYMYADVLTPEQREAFVSRLQEMQTFLKEKVATEEVKLIKSDAEWQSYQIKASNPYLQNVQSGVKEAEQKLHQLQNARNLTAQAAASQAQATATQPQAAANPAPPQQLPPGASIPLTQTTAAKPQATAVQPQATATQPQTTPQAAQTTWQKARPSSARVMNLSQLASAQAAANTAPPKHLPPGASKPLSQATKKPLPIPKHLPPAAIKPINQSKGGPSK